MRAALRIAAYLGAGIAGTTLALGLSSDPAAADDGLVEDLLGVVTEVATPPPPETPPPSPPPTPDTPAPVTAPVEPPLPVLPIVGDVVEDVIEVVDGVTDPIGDLIDPKPPASPPPETGETPDPTPTPADEPDAPPHDRPTHTPVETLIEHLTGTSADNTRAGHGQITLLRLPAPVIADKHAPTSSPGQDVNRGPATSNAPTGESGSPAPPLIAGPAGRLDASPVFSPGVVPPHGVCVPAGRYPSPPRPPA